MPITRCLNVWSERQRCLPMSKLGERKKCVQCRTIGDLRSSWMWESKWMGRDRRTCIVDEESVKRDKKGRRGKTRIVNLMNRRFKKEKSNVNSLISVQLYTPVSACVNGKKTVIINIAVFFIPLRIYGLHGSSFRFTQSFGGKAVSCTPSIQ